MKCDHIGYCVRYGYNEKRYVRNVVFIFAFQTKTAGDRIKTAGIEVKKNLLLLVLMFSGAICMASCGDLGRKSPIKGIQLDSSVCAMLGRTMSDVLFNPGSVTCYTLKGKTEVARSDFQVEPHWVRDSLVGKLSPQLYGILQFALVANSENYTNDSIRIKAPYIPILEFEFQKKKTVVHVLVSTSDHTWTIMYNDKRQIHFNYHDCELIDRFCEMFLKPENK